MITRRKFQDQSILRQATAMGIYPQRALYHVVAGQDHIAGNDKADAHNCIIAIRPDIHNGVYRRSVQYLRPLPLQGGFEIGFNIA